MVERDELTGDGPAAEVERFGDEADSLATDDDAVFADGGSDFEILPEGEPVGH